MLFLLFLLFSCANAQLDLYKKHYGIATQDEQGCASQEGVKPFCLTQDANGTDLYNGDCPEGRSFFSIASESQCQLLFIHYTNAWKDAYSKFMDESFDESFEFLFESDADVAPGKLRCDFVGSNEINIPAAQDEPVFLKIVGTFRPGNPLADENTCNDATMFNRCMCTAFDAESASVELAQLPSSSDATSVAGTAARVFVDLKTWAVVGLVSLIVKFV